MGKRFNPKLRHQARYYVVQALYQWYMSNNSYEAIVAEFCDSNNSSHEFDRDYFELLLKGIIDNVNDLDETISAYIDRPFKELDPIELSILRLGFYELIHQLEIPYRVVINEAVELAKIFGSMDGYKYINGVLDKAQTQVRSQA
ncbi:MAG: transcription antitermination factor NusB [Pseudomonadota bacterium]